MTKVTATQPEREVRPAQDIKPGDWLAAGQLFDGGPGKVLFAHPFLRDGLRHVAITTEETPGGAPVTDIWDHGAPVTLATEAEIAEAQQDEERAKFVAEVRDFATWMEERPWAPVPSRFSVMVHLYDAAGIDTVRAVAEHLGVEVESSEDKTDADVEIGCVEYSVIAWHRKPKPDADADPSGLGYSREADDPTPVSPARGLNIGAPLSRIAEDGHKLDAETAPQCPPECDDLHTSGAPTGLDRSWHADNCPVTVHHHAAAFETACGVSVADLPAAHGYGYGDWDAVDCKACLASNE